MEGNQSDHQDVKKNSSCCEEHLNRYAQQILPASESRNRLNFLGETVMMLVVSRHLFELLSHPNEAVLTDARTVLMQKKTIAKLASDAGLLDWLKQQGVVRDSAFWYQAIDHLKMTTNALIAMVYLDLGMEVAAELILSLEFAP